MVFSCCVKGCKSKDQNNIRLRSFPPLGTKMFEQWKQATRNESLKNMDNVYIRRRKRVCNLHFSQAYRQRPYFCKYDFPMLLNTCIHKGDLDHSYCESVEMGIVNENDRVFINKIISLDHSYCKVPEAETREMQIVDVDTNIKTVDVIAKETNTVDETNIITDNILLNLDQSSNETEEVNHEEMNIVDDSNLIIGNKLVNFYQSYGKTIGLGTSVDQKLNSHVKNVVQVNKNVNSKTRIPRNDKTRRQLLKRLTYLEKLKEKHKIEMQEFGNFRKLDSHVQNFFKSQLRNVGKKCRGGTYTFEDKIFALSIYRQSKAGYRYLLQFFTLPSVTTVMKFYNNIRADPALHLKILNFLEKQIDENSGIEEMLEMYRLMDNEEVQCLKD